MAGPPPQVTHTRKRNDHDRKTIKADGKWGGKPLPTDVLPLDKKTGQREEWHPQTLRWWQSWRQSPQAVQMMSDPDWDFLIDTALMHHMMWSNGRWDFASEVRLRVAKFGATPEDRLKLRLEIEVPEQYPVGQEGAKVTSIRSRRDRIAADG